MAVLQRQILKLVGGLLMGQRNIQTHAGRRTRKSTAISRFHDTRPTTTDYAESRIRQQPGNFFCFGKPGVIFRGAGRPENAHCRTNPTELLESLDEFSHDAQHPP